MKYKIIVDIDEIQLKEFQEDLNSMRGFNKLLSCSIYYYHNKVRKKVFKQQVIKILLSNKRLSTGEIYFKLKGKCNLNYKYVQRSLVEMTLEKEIEVVKVQKNGIKNYYNIKKVR